MKKTYLMVIMALMLLLSQTAESETVNVDLNTTMQTIRGFGGMNFPRWIGTLTNAQVDTAFGNGSGQIGLTIMRIDIPPDSGSWSGQVAAAQRAINNHGAIVFATPWSPPASMKTNGSLIRGELKTDSYDDFANYLTDFANYMSSNGAPLFAVSVQNEPDWLPDYESCGWSPSQMQTFLNNNASVIPTRVLAPETVHYKSDYVSAVASSSQCDIVGVHAYGGTITYYSGKEYWMTEHSTDQDDAYLWPNALDVGKEIHDCMTANMSGYIWWYIRRFYGPMDDSGNITKRGYVMSHFAKFARPGYVRVDATANPSSGVYVTAYKRDSNLVIVAINQNSFSSNVTFSLSVGGSVSSYTKYETTSSNNLSNMGSVGSTNALAANSINTFVGTVVFEDDTTPPTPNLMTWASEPTATGPSSIEMTATTATDISGVEYYFDCLTAGGHDSGWQDSPTYLDTGLIPNKQYTYRVQARDKSPNLNETDWSESLSATTLPPPTDVEILGSWGTGTTHAEENGTNRALIFIAHGELAGNMNLASVTYGGQAMAKIIDRNYYGNNGTAYGAAFILKEAGVAAATSGTFVPTWSTTPTEIGYASVFLSNVDQTTSVGAKGTGGSTTNPVTTTALATSDEDMVILAATCGQKGSYTLNNGFIKGTGQQMASSTGVTGHKPATGASETPSATYSGSVNRQVIIGFVVQAAAAGYQNCSQVQDANLGLLSDLNGDCYVNYADLEIIANHWLDTGCNEFNNYCDWADIEADNDVDFVDFSMFGLQWMQCNDPQDPACTPNW